MTLIYTSGTTGRPKGVQLTHAAVMFAVRSAEQVIVLPPGSRVISWLPAAHIAERMAHHYIPIGSGCTVTCAPDPRQIVAFLPEVAPELVLRGAADLGEAEVGPGGDAGGRARRAA